MPRNVLAYSEEDCKFIIDNWISSDDIKLLEQRFTNRTRKSILLKARKLGLSVKNRRFYKELDLHMLREGYIYLKNLEQTRSGPKAHRLSNTNQDLIKFIIKKDATFVEELNRIKTYLKNTFICCKCNKLLDSNKCCDNRETNINPKNICKECNKDLSQEYRNSGKNTLALLATTMKARESRVEIGKEFLEKLYIKQKGKCHYTDLNMLLESDKDKDFNKVSPDRVDPSKGYTEDNVVLCCWGINRMKLNIPYDEFIILCTLISNKHKLEVSQPNLLTVY